MKKQQGDATSLVVSAGVAFRGPGHFLSAVTSATPALALALLRPHFFWGGGGQKGRERNKEKSSAE